VEFGRPRAVPSRRPGERQRSAARTQETLLGMQILILLNEDALRSFLRSYLAELVATYPDMPLDGDAFANAAAKKTASLWRTVTLNLTADEEQRGVEALGRDHDFLTLSLVHSFNDAANLIRRELREQTHGVLPREFDDARWDPSPQQRWCRAAIAAGVVLSVDLRT
jgi:hypothetical protein